VSRLAERWSQIDERLLDRLVAAALSVGVVLTIVFADHLEGSLALNLAVGLAMTAALVWRRRRPFLTAAIVSGAAVVLQIFLSAVPTFAPAVFSMIVVSYSAGAHAEGRSSLAGVALVSGAILAISILENPDDIVFPFFIFGVAPWVVGRALRGHTKLARELAEKETLARHLREREAARAIAREQSRVARELHDVLAHSLSVMVVQASGARRALATDPAAAIAAAELIERTGRESLAELRHVFGPIRHGEGESLEGTAGLAQLEGLVERARDAGLEATLRVEGDPVELAPGAEAAAYRLVQEALTNALKHTGGTRAEVVVRFRPDGVSISVTDEGGALPAGAPPVEGSGLGLIGMRERIELYDGEVQAGPRAGGGFEVRARLPLERVEAGT
jgi:signal transduction histidine kinase